MALCQRVMAIPLGRPLPAASSDQPGREPRDGLGGVAAPLAPIRSCSRWGLPCRGRYRPRGALLPHPFTLAGGLAAARRFAFCGAFPEVTLAGRYPAPCLHGARTFLCFRSGHPAGWRERLRSLDEAGQPRGGTAGSRPSSEHACLIALDGAAHVAAGGAEGQGQILHAVAQVRLRLQQS
jgi:hypothetical protein